MRLQKLKKKPANPTTKDEFASKADFEEMILKGSTSNPYLPAPHSSSSSNNGIDPEMLNLKEELQQQIIELNLDIMVDSMITSAINDIKIEEFDRRKNAPITEENLDKVVDSFISFTMNDVKKEEIERLLLLSSSNTTTTTTTTNNNNPSKKLSALKIPLDKIQTSTTHDSQSSVDAAEWQTDDKSSHCTAGSPNSNNTNVTITTNNTKQPKKVIPNTTVEMDQISTLDTDDQFSISTAAKYSHPSSSATTLRQIILNSRGEVVVDSNSNMNSLDIDNDEFDTYAQITPSRRISTANTFTSQSTSSQATDLDDFNPLYTG